eukprot:s5274_g6.t1
MDDTGGCRRVSVDHQGGCSTICHLSGYAWARRGLRLIGFESPFGMARDVSALGDTTKKRNWLCWLLRLGSCGIQKIWEDCLPEHGQSENQEPHRCSVDSYVSYIDGRHGDAMKMSIEPRLNFHGKRS